MEVTRRESNCLNTLTVLEMICDPFQVCALEGEGRRGAKSEGKGREMTVANTHFLSPRGHA